MFTSGHDTPESIAGVNATLLNSEIQNERMSATIEWHQDSAQNYRKIDVTNSRQAWIWAVGSTNKGFENTNSADAEIEQHSHYGNTSLSLSQTDTRSLH